MFVLFQNYDRKKHLNTFKFGSMSFKTHASEEFSWERFVYTCDPLRYQEIAKEGLVYGVHSSPFGRVLLATFQEKLCGFLFQGRIPDSCFFEQAQSHLKAPLIYFSPEKTLPWLEDVLERKPIPLLISGTPFQLRVWQELCRIPYGEVTTYQEIAVRVGTPKAMRSIGQALKANPLAYVLPCHRVVSASGHLGGYRWGTLLKQYLLALEGHKSLAWVLEEEHPFANHTGS